MVQKKEAPMPLSETASLKEIQEHFAADKFATCAAGVHVVEASPGHAVCSMPLQAIHRNALGNVMGGALFTLADFALAVAANIGQPPTVSVDANISFLRATKGSTLTATATCRKQGRNLGFYTITIADDLGATIATITTTATRI